MKALSIWQPWASLIMSGHKKIETRSWPAPYSIRGQRIAIASTKSVRAEQRRATEQPAFRDNYATTGLPKIDELPMGCILGTAIVHDCREIDNDFISLLDEREEVFGSYEPGRFAWYLTDPIPLDRALPVKGYQGLWNWNRSTNILHRQ